jgi:hypothetical protein
MKQITIAILLLTIGMIAGKYIFSHQEEEIGPTAMVVNKADSQNCQDELNQAKELYGKVFTTFLATIGVKLQGKQKIELSQLIDNPQKYKVEKAKDLPKNLKQKSPKVEISADIVETNHQVPYEYEKLSKSAAGIILQKPNLYYAESKFIKVFDSNMKKINGSYTGKLYKTKKDEYNNTADEILLEINFSERDDKTITGNYSLKLSRNGTPYSTSSGDGNNSLLRRNPKDLNMILMKSAPDTFFQFNIKNPNVLNYYKDGEHAGYAQLIKN